MSPQVELLTDTELLALDKDKMVIVPAGNLTMVISGSAQSRVFLNGRTRQAQSISGSLVLNMDPFSLSELSVRNQMDAKGKA